jgi:hypothetical protein
MIEAMIILAEIIRHLEVRPATVGEGPRPKLTILTRPDREVVMGIAPVWQPKRYNRPPTLDDSPPGPSASLG